MSKVHKFSVKALTIYNMVLRFILFFHPIFILPFLNRLKCVSRIPFLVSLKIEYYYKSCTKFYNQKVWTVEKEWSLKIWNYFVGNILILCLCFIVTENYRLLDDSQTGAQNYIATFISIKPTKITAIKNQAASEQKISVYSGDK